jgi:hypothetical protein
MQTAFDPWVPPVIARGSHVGDHELAKIAGLSREHYGHDFVKWLYGGAGDSVSC